jgi:hypothetical protein
MIYKKLILCPALFCLALPVFAEKIPIKIEPIQVISTDHDEIEVGDWINFQTIDDIYVNDKLYIEKGTKVAGVVDFIHPNGWGGDSADIVFKTFYTIDVDNTKIKIDSPLEINGNSEAANQARSVGVNEAGNITSFLIRSPFIVYVSFIVRGAEINIEPDTKIYNLFIER